MLSSRWAVVLGTCFFFEGAMLKSDYDSQPA
jgi:hypothetical protein